MDPILLVVTVIAFCAGGAAVGLCMLMVERRDYEAGRRDGWRARGVHDRRRAERLAEREAWLRVR